MERGFPRSANQQRTRLSFFFEPIFIYRTYATSPPLYDIFLLLRQMLEVQICTSSTFASTPHLRQLKPTSYARCLRWRCHGAYGDGRQLHCKDDNNDDTAASMPATSGMS